MEVAGKAATIVNDSMMLRSSRAPTRKRAHYIEKSFAGHVPSCFVSAHALGSLRHNTLATICPPRRIALQMLAAAWFTVKNAQDPESTHALFYSHFSDRQQILALTGWMTNVDNFLLIQVGGGKPKPSPRLYVQPHRSLFFLRA